MRSDLPFYSTGQLAVFLGVPVWRVARLFELGVLQEPARLGRQRAIPRASVPHVIDALRQRGWYPVADSRQGVAHAE